MEASSAGRERVVFRGVALGAAEPFLLCQGLQFGGFDLAEGFFGLCSDLWGEVELSGEFADGFEGEVPLQGVAGTIFVDIAPMEPAGSGVPATVEPSAPVMVEPSAPQALREQGSAGLKAALPSEARGSSEGQAVGSQP